jgi:hypothetical protein
MKQNFKINVGLNNNPFTFEQVNDYLRNVCAINRNIIFTNFSTVPQIGTYNGANEPTLVAEFESKCSQSEIIREVERLCVVFTQECIAISGTFDLLVYPITFNGQRFKFDNQYFIDTIK